MERDERCGRRRSSDEERWLYKQLTLWEQPPTELVREIGHQAVRGVRLAGLCPQPEVQLATTPAEPRHVK